MTDIEAFEFLKSVQPMPDDSNISNELIERYDKVRKHFIQNPNEQAIPLLLNSFGNGDGRGVYQLVEDAIAVANPKTAASHLASALASPHSSVRYWAAQISANYNDDRLIAPLLNLLADKSEDTRMAALTSLEKYAKKSNAEQLLQLKALESSPEIRMLYDDIILSIR